MVHCGLHHHLIVYFSKRLRYVRVLFTKVSADFIEIFLDHVCTRTLWIFPRVSNVIFFPHQRAGIDQTSIERIGFCGRTVGNHYILNILTTYTQKLVVGIIAANESIHKENTSRKVVLTIPLPRYPQRTQNVLFTNGVH